jgi:hypothetical protein
VAFVLIVHRWVAYLVMALLLVVLLAALALRVGGRAESPTWLRALQHWTENTLIVQIVLGGVLLLSGRRVVGDLAFLHYFYGSLFPFIAIVGGRIAALRREEHDYVGLAWGAFFALGLISRALLTGLQSTGRSLFDLI